MVAPVADVARRIIRIHAHSFHIGDGEELLRPHGYSYCSRSGVGIDIEVISLIIGGNGGYNRDVALSCHDHQFVQTTANRIMEILPDGSLIDKISTYDEYLESDEMARKRTIYSADKEDDED